MTETTVTPGALITPSKSARRRQAIGGLIFRVARQVFLILAVAFALFPVVLAFFASFKSLFDFYDNPLGLPTIWVWQNYVDVWQQAHIPEYALNSTVIVLVSVPLILTLASLAGYGLTRYDFPLSKYIYVFFLAGLLIPVQLTVLPTILQLRTLLIGDSHAALIVTYVALGMPFAVFLMAGFIRTLPRELSEAAQLDGAGEFRAFREIMLPQARPALATVAILNFVTIWNEFFLALILAPSVPTLQVGVNNLRGYYSTNWGNIFAGVVLAMLPVIIGYLMLTRHFIRGLSAGAVKG